MDSVPQNLQMYKYVSIISGIGTLISSALSGMLLYFKNQSAIIFLPIAVITLIICITCYCIQKHLDNTEFNGKQNDNQSKVELTKDDNQAKIKLAQIEYKKELQLKEKDIQLAQINKDRDIEIAKINKEQAIEIAKIQASKQGDRPNPPSQIKLIK